MKKSRFALFQSVIALVLCVSMLAGTTFAWFTDSVSSGTNTIAAGNLDIELEYRDANGTWHEVDESTAVLNNEAKWEPGHTEVAYLRISNAGNLALKYALGVGVLEETGSINVNGEPFYLSDHIRFGIITSKNFVAYGTREEARDALTASQLISQGEISNDDTLKAADKERYVTLVVYMPEEIGNVANHATGVTPPEIKLGIQLTATQAEYESDSFGKNYDSGLTPDVFDFPAKKIAVTASAGVTTDESNKVADEVTLADDKTSAKIPEGVLLDNGTKVLTLEVSTMEQSGANIVLNENEASVSLDVHVEGVSKDNTQPMEITIQEVAPKGLNMGNYKFYHVENGITNEMTLVASDVAFSAHNQFKYDPGTGDITLYMATFSEVALVADTKNAWEGNFDYSWYVSRSADYTIANADQLAAFGSIVGGMNGQTQDSFAGKTVKLIADVNLGYGVENHTYTVFYPIGYYNSEGTYERTNTAITSGLRNFEGTFDGNGHTISNFYHNTWEMKGDHNWYKPEEQYYRDGMGLFGRIYKGTVKNLTVSNFSSDGEIATTGVIAAYADGATFENIAIVGCNPRVYNIGNGGIVGCVGWYAKEANLKTTFKNITVDNTNKISALWGSYDVPCGGIVGQYYPTSGQTSAGTPKNGGVSFENCHISAQMDVYNDVCANYQYYAYRYAGMLIGSIRENETKDGHVYPKMDGITAKDCTVHFGTWNDYYYCEIIDNTTASYTHDYQMSRLTEIKAIDGTTITYLDGTTGTVPASGRANYVIVDYTKGHGTENATCYHFKDGKVWSHSDGGTEIVDGKEVLKEDKQHIYLEFNNLVTGYGWGVTSKGLTDFKGVTNMDITQGDHEKSVEKFESEVAELANNKEYKLGDIFNFVDNGVELVPGALTVAVTNLDENNPVSATVVYDRENWENGTITLTGAGKVQITIQDYYFCTPTTITVDVTDRQPEVKFETKFTGDFLYRVGNQNAVKLDSLFKAKDGAQIGNVSVTVEDVEGTAASGAYTPNATWTNGTIQFNGTGVVKVTIKDDDKYCTPTELILEVVDATNVTGLSGTISGNVVLLNNCGLSSLTVSSRNTVYGNGFTATYNGNGQYLNNGLKQGIVTVSENGTLDNLRIVAPIYPKAYLYYGSTLLGDYVQGGPSSVEGDKTRYHYQLSAVAASGKATISNCYIYGGRTNIFVNTGDVTITDTVLECGTVANVQIQSNASHTVTFEDVTTIQYQVHPTIGDTSKVMLGAGILVGPETNDNPTIVLNGDFKQYNWVTEDDESAVSDQTAKAIIGGALEATKYKHIVNNKTASNLGIIYMNTYDVEVENHTGLPYVTDNVNIKYSGNDVSGKVCSLQNATEDQIHSDYVNADKNTVNGNYAPQFKYSDDLGGQQIPDDGGDEFVYREGDIIYVMFPSGESRELDLAALVNIERYTDQDLGLVISVKNGKGEDVKLKDDTTIELSTADTYTVTYSATDSSKVTSKSSVGTENEDGSITYSWNVTISVFLKDTAIPDARFKFVADSQKMGYYEKSSITGTSIYQYLPFLAGLQIYDYNGQTEYLRFDGDKDYNKVASIEVTNKYSGNDARVVVKLTDGGIIEMQFLARADSGGGSTYTGSIKTSNSKIYFVNDGTTSDKESTTTAAYWIVDYYKFTGNNGVMIQSAQQTFNSTGSSASTPSGSFNTTIKYTVTYDANGGNSGQNTGYATSATTAVTLPTPTRSGYIFAGWYTAASGGTRVGGAGDSYTPSANITLYAQWGKPCTVTYNADGGSCDPASEKYTGTALTLPTPTREGYWFIGWYDADEGGNKIGDAGTTYNPSGEITLYAHWQEKIEYTITYNANGGTCGTASATYQGTALTLPTSTRTGYTFNGWYTAASGGTKVGDAGATYIPSANITLYAQWTIGSYTITVTTNNATVKVNGTTVNNNGTVSIQYGAQVTVEVTYSKSDNRSTTIKGTDGTSYTSPFTMPAQEVTINATSNECVTPDTLITLADGSQVRVDSLKGDEMLLVWNLETGKYDTAPIVFVDNEQESEYEIIHLYFSDGSDVKVIYEHGFFDLDLGEYVYIDANNYADYIGHRFVTEGDIKSNNWNVVTLDEVVIETEVTTAWSPVTFEHLCYYTNGVLSMPGGIEGLFNIFEVDTDLMRYDAVKMQKDIETFGLFTIEDFGGMITEDAFNAFNGAYLKVAIAKGILTWEDIAYMAERYIPLMK